MGLTSQDARRTARFAELRLVIEERPTDSGLRGRVLGQRPAPGADASPGDIVTVTVGARPGVAIPDVHGTEEHESLAQLREAGLVPSRRVTRHSDRIAPGHVIRTRPRAGTEVPVGTRIAYVVASPPRPRTAPNRREARRSRLPRTPDGGFMAPPDEG